MTMPTMPNAHATLGALGSMRPMICQIIFVIGKYFSRMARIKPSLTSSMAKEKVRIVPAIKLAITSGKVILRSVRNGVAPRFADASSRVTLAC